MELFWEYDIRSQDALTTFDNCVKLRKENLQNSNTTVINKWHKLRSLFEQDSMNSQQKSIEKAVNEVIYTNNENINMIADGVVKMEVVNSIETTSNISNCVEMVESHSNKENISEFVCQVIEDFNNDDENMESALLLLFCHDNSIEVLNLLSEKITDKHVYSLCRTFCEIVDENFILDHKDCFLELILLPAILRIGNTKEMECAIFECFKKMDYQIICQKVFVPILLNEQCSVSLTNILEKLDGQVRSYILLSYFEQCKTIHSWTLNVILSIIKTLQNEEFTQNFVENLIIFLKQSCIDFKKDLTYSKLVHTTINSLKMNNIKLEENCLNYLTNIVNVNETVFKNPCMKLLNT